MNAQLVFGMTSILSTVALLPDRTLPVQSRLLRQLSKCLTSFRIFPDQRYVILDWTLDTYVRSASLKLAFHASNFVFDTPVVIISSSYLVMTYTNDNKMRATWALHVTT